MVVVVGIVKKLGRLKRIASCGQVEVGVVGEVEENASCLVVEENCRLKRLKRIVMKVFLLPGSAYVSPRRPADCAGPRPHDPDQTSYLVLPTAHLSPLWTLPVTIKTRAAVDRTAQLLSGTAPRSIPPPSKCSGTKNCDLNSLPSWLQKGPLFFSLGLFCLSVCLRVWDLSFK